MVPGGSGEVIGFVKDAAGKVDSMTYAGFKFKKLAQ